MENIYTSLDPPGSPRGQIDMSSVDMKAVISLYIADEETREKLLQWAISKSTAYYLRNIGNTKANIEETKFEAVNNIGIEYSKDNKNKLSYRNKPLIQTNVEYKDICDLIKSTSGGDKETLRYLLFGIKCLRANVHYDIELVQDYDYSKYFGIGNSHVGARCPTCNSFNTTPMILQTRSSDEAPTVRYVCKDCNKNFSPPKFVSNREPKVKSEPITLSSKNNASGSVTP